MASIHDRVIKVIHDHMDFEAGKVVPTSAFVDDLGADSLDMVELLIAAEQEFDIEISDDEAERLVTVSDAIKLVERKNDRHSLSPAV